MTKKRFNLAFVGGITVIVYWITLTIPYIGKIPENLSDPYSWHLTLTVATAVVPPFILGYLAAKE
jgi:putative flippase GtrA